MLLAIMLACELFLMRSRLSGDRERKADRGSLRLLFAIIFGSIALAWLAGRLVPQARFDALLALDPLALQVLRWSALGLFVAGLALRWYSMAWLGRLFTYDVAIAADHRVVDTGPYRLIRHPAYTGSLLSFVGLGVVGGNALSLALLLAPIALAFLHRIAIEETALEAALGSRYVDYAARTRRLIPFVY
jgi:protein-S-isoprenylcysteine O-methyltransferase